MVRWRACRTSAYAVVCLLRVRALFQKRSHLNEALLSPRSIFLATMALNGGIIFAISYLSTDSEECDLHGLCGSGLTFDSKAHSTLGLALFLLLSFRTKGSYDKFWEGRKLWGASVCTLPVFPLVYPVSSRSYLLALLIPSFIYPSHSIG